MLTEPSPGSPYALDSGSLTQGQVLAAAFAAVTKLGWDISWAGPWVFKAAELSGKGISENHLLFRIEKEQRSIEALPAPAHPLTPDSMVERFIPVFEEIKQKLTPAQLDELFHMLETTGGAGATIPTRIDSTSSLLSFFRPRKGYFVTPLIIDLNILVFIVMVIMGVNIMSPDSESLIRWGANFKPLTLGGEWWRLLSNCFLHIGIFHLLMNMYALVYIGLLLEPFLGRLNFLVAYILTGLLASLASLWWHDITVSAGASGAIFGMYGVFLALLTTNLIEKSVRGNMLSSIGVFVGYNLLFGLAGGIDNAARIGGLLSGIVIGYAMYPGIKTRGLTTRQIIIAAALTLTTTVCCALAIRNIPNDTARFQQMLDEYARLETAALKVYEKPPATPKNVMLKSIQDSGIRYWNQNLVLLENAGKLKLPPPYQKRVLSMLQYTQLRKAAYELMYKSVAEETDRYNDSLQYYNTEIRQVLDQLKK